MGVSLKRTSASFRFLAPRPRRWALVLPGFLLGLAGLAQAEPARYKIYLKAPGMYQVSYADLARAGGLDSPLDSAALSLSHQDEAVPILVDDGGDGRFEEGDAVVFRADHLAGDISFLNEHSDTNVYWLSVDGAGGRSRFETVPPAPDGACRDPGFAVTSQRLERDLVRVRFSTREARRQEVWFWQRLSQIDDSPFEQTLDLSDLRADDTQPTELRVHLRGWSRLGYKVKDLGDDHEVEVLWDGRPVARTSWDNNPEGQLIVIEDLPLDLLTAGSHRVGVRVVPRLLGESKDPQVDVVLFNWLELSYPRQLDLEEGQHRLAVVSGAPAGEAPAADSKLSCLRLLSRGGPLEVFSAGGRRWASTSPAQLTAPEGEELWAVAGAAWRRPEGVVLDRPSRLRNTGQQADYLMIVHSELLQAAAPLAEFHRQRGLTVRLVDVEDIYDEFYGGIVHPLALRRFIDHAYHQWQAPAPRFVLLVGDASWDPHQGEVVEGEEREYADWTFQPRHQTRFGTNKSTPYAKPASLGHRNLVPTAGYSHSEGDAASDNWFVAIDGEDDLPDLAIGRLPVTEPEEVAAIVAKTIRYMSDPEPGDWRRRVLWISDGTKLRDDTSDILAGSLSAHGLTARKVKPDRNSQTNDDHRANLLGAFAEGQLVVHFTGHGGRYIWRTAPADFKKNRDLFTLDDLDRLPAGGKLPVVVSMTCYSAPFDHPTADSIGEKFLRLEDRGAVAVVAASWRTGASRRLSNIVMDELIRPGSTVGEALRVAKSLSKQADFIHMYNLLGDPALSLALPEPLPGLMIEAGEVPVVVASLEAPSTLEGAVEWVDKAGEVVHSQQVASVDAATVKAAYDGPREALPEVLAARLFLHETGGTQRSWVGGGTLEEARVDRPNLSNPDNAFEKRSVGASGTETSDREGQIKAAAAKAAGENRP